MEKSSFRARRKWSIGLLIYILTSFLLFAETKESFVFAFDSECEVYENEPYSLVLFIPDEPLSKVQLSKPSLPDSVVFLGSSKIDYFSNTTVIKIELLFTQPGTVSIPNTTVTIGRKKYPVSFPSVEVLIHPEKRIPTLIMESRGPFYQGQKTVIQLSGTDFLSIDEVDWPLSEYGIIEKISSDDKVWKYSFIPYETGDFKLPDMNVVVQRLNKSQYTYVVEGLSGTASKNLNKKTNLTEVTLSSLFKKTEEIAAEKKEVDPNLIPQICRDLRNQFKIIRLGLCGFAFLGLLLSIVVFLKRKKMISLIVILSILCLTGIGFISLSSFEKNKAVVVETSLRTVPEKNSNVKMNLENGSIITVKKHMENWYLVKTKKTKTVDSISGWLPKEDVVLISDWRYEDGLWRYTQ
jgi:hypothetical protein